MTSSDTEDDAAGTGGGRGVAWLRRVARAGAVVFLVGYGLAIPLYPGGSPFDRTRPGYDLADNYLCDAFRAVAYDGRPNPLGARLGQLGMVGLVVAASAALALAPEVFAHARPRLAGATRVFAGLAGLGMMLVPLTPAHVYGTLHFVAIGVAAVPSMAALACATVGTLTSVVPDAPAARRLRLATRVAAIACSLHFVQYLLQAGRLLGEHPTVPRAQKLVVLTVVAFVFALADHVGARPPTRGTPAA